MAGVASSNIGQQRACTEPVAKDVPAATAAEIRSALKEEIGQDLRETQGAIAGELRRVRLGMMLGTEDELEDPGE